MILDGTKIGFCVSSLGPLLQMSFVHKPLAKIYVRGIESHVPSKKEIERNSYPLRKSTVIPDFLEGAITSPQTCKRK